MGEVSAGRAQTLPRLCVNLLERFTMREEARCLRLCLLSVCECVWRS
jgi:hypothetical protein